MNCNCMWTVKRVSKLKEYPKACKKKESEINSLCFSCLQLEGRKISSSQFLKVLSTMRVWEICAPDINAAIEVDIAMAKLAIEVCWEALWCCG